MLSKILLLIGAVAVSAAPTLSVSARSPGSEWTIHAFVRSCNGTSNSCLYNYSISENDGTPSTNCSYTIVGTATTTAQTTGYTALAGCASPAYSLNQGWDTAGMFATLVVTNVTSQYRAFYGFNAAMLVDGVVQADQTNPSTPSGVAPAKQKRQTSAWTVHDFSWDSYAPLSSTFHFTLDTGTSTWNCTLFNAPADPKDTFYGSPCAEDSYHAISWGYIPEGFAVMTVADYTNAPGYKAWFGYSNVNSWNTSGARPADAGPSAVPED